MQHIYAKNLLQETVTTIFIRTARIVSIILFFYELAIRKNSQKFL